MMKRECFIDKAALVFMASDPIGSGCVRYKLRRTKEPEATAVGKSD